MTTDGKNITIYKRYRPEVIGKKDMAKLVFEVKATSIEKAWDRLCEMSPNRDVDVSNREVNGIPLYNTLKEAKQNPYTPPKVTEVLIAQSKKAGWVEV